LLADGVTVRVARGLYILAERESIGNPDLVTVAIKYPDSVISMISALHCYNLTEQIPHFVYIALPRGVRRPQLDYPPLKIIWLSEHTYQAGVLEISIDNTKVRIYSPKKNMIR